MSTRTSLSALHTPPHTPNLAPPLCDPPLPSPSAARRAAPPGVPLLTAPQNGAPSPPGARARWQAGRGRPAGGKVRRGGRPPARSPRPFVRGRRGPAAPGKGPRGASTSGWEFSPFPREGRVVRWEAVGLRSVRGRHCVSFPPAEPRVVMPPGARLPPWGYARPQPPFSFSVHLQDEQACHQLQVA